MSRSWSPDLVASRAHHEPAAPAHAARLASAEEEPGRLRPENARLRERVSELETAAWREMVQLGHELQEPGVA
jgi:hypothetical protein